MTAFAVKISAFIACGIGDTRYRGNALKITIVIFKSAMPSTVKETCYLLLHETLTSVSIVRVDETSDGHVENVITAKCWVFGACHDRLFVVQFQWLNLLPLRN